MDRIAFLREIALNNKYNIDEFYYLFYKRYSENLTESEYERYSDAFYYAFSNLTPDILEGELIVGKYYNNLTDTEKEEWQTTYLKKARDRAVMVGQDSHMAIDYNLLLSRGVKGIIEDIEEYEKSCEEDKKEFYSCAKKCLKAVILHSENYSVHAENLAKTEKDLERKKELLEIARICKKVPLYPAESFYEALQSVHFITYCLSLNPLRLCQQQFQLGHPDRYLLPYYENDIKNGVITKEKAQLLLDLLGIQINMRVPNGLSSGYMVGGRDENCNIVANDLTVMLMQVIDDIKLVYPSVGLCYIQDMPDVYLEKACNILSNGRSHPAIFNDDVIVKGLKHYGVPDKEAHEYIHSTCVEITPVGSSNVWVASPYTNMAQILLDTMDREYDSFNSHLLKVYNLLDQKIKNDFIKQEEFRKIRKERSINPLLSCFVNDCLKRGLDIEKGGAKYNWIMPSFVGMANLVDSLYALKVLVYDNRKISVCDFKKILDENFENHAELRNYILNDLPKYGNDIDDIDSLFVQISNHISSECEKYQSITSQAKLIPSVFCWIMHARMGKETIATPDGRLKGFPLGDGSGPCQGREKKGPTASILSSTKWLHDKFIGGVAVNIKFSKTSIGEKSIGVMKSLIKSYIKCGGFEMQINVVDNDTLKKALKCPEEYQDLVVRIGGYSDYFVKLPPEMQQEVILRTEHKI